MGRAATYAVWIVVTMLAEAGITWALASAVSVPFMELAFFIAIVGATVIWFFSSQGGFTSAAVNLDVQASTGMKTEQEEQRVLWNPVLVGALAYVPVSAVLTFWAYREYFF